MFALFKELEFLGNLVLKFLDLQILLSDLLVELDEGVIFFALHPLEVVLKFQNQYVLVVVTVLEVFLWGLQGRSGFSV